MSMKTYEAEENGRRYCWDGKRWFDVKTYSTPSVATAVKLNQQLQTLLAPDDERIRDPQALLERAKVARDAGQLVRAEKLLQRVLDKDPDHLGALDDLRPRHSARQGGLLCRSFRHAVAHLVVCAGGGVEVAPGIQEGHLATLSVEAQHLTLPAAVCPDSLQARSTSGAKRQD